MGATYRIPVGNGKPVQVGERDGMRVNDYLREHDGAMFMNEAGVRAFLRGSEFPALMEKAESPRMQATA